MNSFLTWFSRLVAVVAALLALVTTSLVNAQSCGIPGMVGNAAVAAAVNTYFAGSGTPAAGTSSITLLAGATSRRGVAVNLVAGDLVLIMQMQDNTAGALAGNYEYAVVTVGGGVGATIQLASNLVNSYAQTITAASGIVRTFQVIRVPQYSTATLSGTINVLPWFVNATTGAATGGVFAVDVAGLLTANAVTINANARGFRGGLGVNSSANRAGGTALDNDYACDSGTLNGSYKGEGTAGIPKRVLGFDAAGAAGVATTYDAAGELFVVAANRGFINGSCGRAAQGNSGGGGNDGDPPTQTNGTNSGGGGGSNAGVGGNGGNNWNQGDPNLAALNQTPSTIPPAATGTGGWPSGGRGGAGLAPVVATKIYLGGGGGAGSANNGSANAITTFPPTAPGVSPTVVANGASGALTSSGAPGGGIVMWRAGAVTISAASVINAQGAHAYTKNPSGDTDSAGGGGAGGTVVIDNASGSLTNLTINAFGGIGGSSNYYNHGPAGGGGGGYIFTRGTGATTNVIAGTAGTDGCCAGGSPGNGSPKNYGATDGAVGLVTTSGTGNPPGAPSGAQCLPNLTVNKVAVTPLVTAATGATAQYTLNVRNTGGAATNAFIYDTGLPPGWTYVVTTPAIFAYAPAPPLAGGAFAAGAETTAATGVASPPVLPVNTYTVFNTSTLSLRAAATAPGVTPTTGQGSVTFGSFFIPQNGSISVTFAVSIPDAATVGTYHNGAGASFLDPTRTSNTGRAIAMATNISANRNSLAYSSNTTFQSGGTSTVAGQHHDGLVAGPTTDDVRLLPDISITKTGSSSAAVNATFNYTLTPRNNGRAIAVQTFATTQATDVVLANLGTVLGASPLTLTDTLPSGVAATNTFSGTNWSCSGTAPVVCTLPDTNAYPIAAATNFPLVTGTVRITCIGGNGKTNTAVISPGAGETLLTNNTGTFTTTITPACVNATLTVAKINAGITLVAGQTTSYTITVANLGPGAAGGTILTDPMAQGLSCTVNPTCTVAGGAVCPASLAIGTLQLTGLVIPTLPSGSTATFALTCGVTATGL